MSIRLETYLALEREMMALDDVDDPMADVLRDALDPIWHALTDEDRTFLNHRSIASGPAYGVRVPDTRSVFADVPAGSPPVADCEAPVRVDEWKCVA